jgi:hypothetical protein
MNAKDAKRTGRVRIKKIRKEFVNACTPTLLSVFSWRPWRLGG